MLALTRSLITFYRYAFSAKKKKLNEREVIMGFSFLEEK